MASRMLLFITLLCGGWHVGRGSVNIDGMNEYHVSLKKLIIDFNLNVQSAWVSNPGCS